MSFNLDLNQVSEQDKLFCFFEKNLHVHHLSILNCCWEDNEVSQKLTQAMIRNKNIKEVTVFKTNYEFLKVIPLVFNFNKSLTNLSLFTLSEKCQFFFSALCKNNTLR
jgi:hypothetical protein